jgi:two-component system response regulator HydG
MSRSRPGTRPRSRRAGGRRARRAPPTPAAARAAPQEAWESDPLLGDSRAIARVREQIHQVASTRAAVLIDGEAGTGKGAAARAIHAGGPRRAGPFVAIDCERSGGEALERELFGGDHMEAGALARAHQGTLFVEEIGAASAAAQARLLRLLQEGAFERTGGGATLRVDVRLVAGTRHGLDARVREGRFRDDLLRRLSAARIAMPALRDRAEDIPTLVERFVREANRRHRRGVRQVTRGVLERLERHAWPGNVRELRDTIDAMVVSAPGGRPLDLADLPPALRAESAGQEPLAIAPGMTVEEAVRALIVATLEHVGHDRPRAAAMLGIGLRTLYRKIKQYGIR